MTDFLFNGVTKLITEPSGAGDSLFTVKRDVYSAWKRWVQRGDGAPFLRPFDLEGGRPIGTTGLFTGVTYILINGWKIRGADRDHQLFLDGNIYAEDGKVTSPNPNFNVEVFINSSTQAQGISTTGTQGGFTENDRTDLQLTRDHARAANQQTKMENP